MSSPTSSFCNRTLGVIHFYETEHSLHDRVAGFLRGGLKAGQPALVIATRPHLQAIAGRLAAENIDVDAADRSGALVLIDPRRWLVNLTSESALDEGRLKAIVNLLLHAAFQGSSCGRVYSEMVDLVWQEICPSAALRVRQVWHDVATAHRRSVFLAYSLRGIYREVLMNPQASTIVRPGGNWPDGAAASP